MARIRSIHPGQWTDEAFVECSFAARLLAIGLRNEADDLGVFEWKPTMLKMRLFPADDVDVIPLLAELEATDQVLRYEVDGRQYGIIRNFGKFQKPRSPKYVHPPPPGTVPEAVEPEPLQQNAETEPQMEEGGGKMEEVSSDPDGSGEPDVSPPDDDLLEMPLSMRRPPDGDYGALLFGPGLDWLASVLDKPPNACRSAVGRFLQLSGQDHRAVWNLLVECEQDGVAEPVAYITRCLQPRSEPDPLRALARVVSGEVTA